MQQETEEALPQEVNTWETHKSVVFVFTIENAKDGGVQQSTVVNTECLLVSNKFYVLSCPDNDSEKELTMMELHRNPMVKSPSDRLTRSVAKKAESKTSL